MPSSHTPVVLCQWFSALAAALDPRSAARLACLFFGAVVARGRRTVTSWIRAASLSAQFRCCYATLSAAGKRAERVATTVVREVLKPLFGTAGRVVLAVDDTPTARYGPCVQGAGVHHNPTPGPAGSAFVYGHVWVVVALLATHPSWGVIALPLLARLYIRKKDLPAIDKKHRPAFATKLEMAVELVNWAKFWLGFWGKPLWVVADGAYAKAPFLKAMRTLGVTVVSRLRKDAALWSVPEEPVGKKGPGRPAIYGQQRLVLSKRAGQKGGWTTETFELYGEEVEKTYKTFVATWGPTGGALRVVLVSEEKGWVAFFCTDAEASVADILGLVSDRFSLEMAFRDLKEVVGAGQQQVRHIWASVGCFHVCLWTFTMTEAWAWNQDAEALVAHRRASPWDDKPRRPSHADKRRAWRQELLAQELTAVLPPGTNNEQIRNLTERLLDIAA
jgi:hypothetical protein